MSEKMSVVWPILFEPSQLKLIHAAAEAEGQTVAEFIRHTSLDEAKYWTAPKSKVNKTDYIACRCSEQVKQELQNIAKEEDCSLSEVIRKILIEMLTEYGYYPARQH